MRETIESSKMFQDAHWQHVTKVLYLLWSD